MRQTEYRLFLALAISLLLHLAPLLSVAPSPPPPPTQPLQAELRPPPPPIPAEIPLKLDPLTAPDTHIEKAAVNPISRAKSANPRPIKTWTQAIRQHLEKLQKTGDFYPAEAISQGQQGEALVLLIIDQSGNVVAARLEQSSGYRLLDDAALRAVRSVHSLPADAPRETLLPVRFRLH